MEEGKFMITATDVMNYNYCPRIIYYVHVLKKPQITTKKEYKSLRIHQSPLASVKFLSSL